ncbi:MAG: hypothetical protein LIP01_13790 [Tannerellaceae bacterium]|nr:hypothetical protein [Tannerellaceae bacterium]
MINAPADNGQDWKTVRTKARAKILQSLSKALQTDIEPCIAVEEFADPLTIQERTGSDKGALYGASSNSIFSAFLRHPNHLKQIQNLFFTGGSVHPGGGIPLCLASASIVENEILEMYGK